MREGGSSGHTVQGWKGGAWGGGTHGSEPHVGATSIFLRSDYLEPLTFRRPCISNFLVKHCDSARKVIQNVINVYMYTCLLSFV